MKLRNMHRNVKKIFTKSAFKLLILPILIFIIQNAVIAQHLPDKIRGYKVYKQEIVITEQTIRDSDKGRSVKINLEEPELADVSVSGVKLEVGGKLTIYGQSGTVDFISFKDFEINGVKVDVEEYTDSFDFTKNEPFVLKNPVAVNISASQTLRAAWKEVKDTKNEWLVSGKVFVFGKFKKFGFKFKRVIPVAIKIKIPNPLI